MEIAIKVMEIENYMDIRLSCGNIDDSLPFA